MEVVCQQCGKPRLVRGDSVRKAQKEGKVLWCKPCRNQNRFVNKLHPLKGTGVKNDKDLEYTRRSYYKAKRRCKLGVRHHSAYKDVEFKFSSLKSLVDEIGLRPKDKTLDRVDPLGHYEPGNVRWSTALEQAKNRMPRGYWVK